MAKVRCPQCGGQLKRVETGAKCVECGKAFALRKRSGPAAPPPIVEAEVVESEPVGSVADLEQDLGSCRVVQAAEPTPDASASRRKKTGPVKMTLGVLSGVFLLWVFWVNISPFVVGYKGPELEHEAQDALDSFRRERSLDLRKMARLQELDGKGYLTEAETAEAERLIAELESRYGDLGMSVTRTPTIRMADYQRIRNGMSYAEVVAVFGSEGQEVAKSQINTGLTGGVETAMYQWINPDGSNASVMFQDDQVVQRAQFGLR